jgi:hypothetical protein
MKEIKDMTEDEAKECKEKIEQYLFLIEKQRKVSNLEWQLQNAKAETLEIKRQLEKQEEFDYTHR